MAKLFNRAYMTTATTGTGAVSLWAAVPGYQAFSDAGVSDGDVIRYTIEDGNAWEIGQGTYTSSGATLSRTVLESSNADAPINLSGNARIFISAASEDILSALRADTLVELKALPAIENVNYTLTSGALRGDFIYTTEGAPFAAETTYVVKLDDVDLSVGALVRKPTTPITTSSNSDVVNVEIALGIVRIPVPAGADPVVPIFIEDSSHASVNAESVEFLASGPNVGALKITNANPGPVNGTHWIQPDETYTAGGMRLGIRGENDGPVVYAYRELEFSLNMQSLALTPHPWFDPADFSATSNGDGSVTITHPSVGWSSQPVIVTPISSSGYTPRIVSSDATSVRIQNFGAAQGILTRTDATTMTYTGPMQTPMTATFNTGTGVLTVDFGDFTLPTHFQHGMMLQSSGSVPVLFGDRTLVGGSGGTGFTVPLFDASGAALTSITNVKIQIAIGSWMVPYKTQAGLVRVGRGVAQIDLSLAQNDTGNIWFASHNPQTLGYVRS